MEKIFDFIILNITFLLIVIPMGFIRYKMFRDKRSNKVIIRELFILSIIIIIGNTIYNFLPKYETEINIHIKNKAINTFVVININGDYIYTDENILNINKKSGFIAIKTENANKIVYYNNEKSIFPCSRRINIIINNEKIEINSFFVKISNLIENHHNYDLIFDMVNKIVQI